MGHALFCLPRMVRASKKMPPLGVPSREDPWGSRFFLSLPSRFFLSLPAEILIGVVRNSLGVATVVARI